MFSVEKRNVVKDNSLVEVVSKDGRKFTFGHADGLETKKIYDAILSQTFFDFNTIE